MNSSLENENITTCKTCKANIRLLWEKPLLFKTYFFNDPENLFWKFSRIHHTNFLTKSN